MTDETVAVGWWWNRQDGDDRRDIHLRRFGKWWTVEARRGALAKTFDFASEDEAMDRVLDLMDASGDQWADLGEQY